MLEPEETAANQSLKDALRAILRARELCERAGYGSQVIGALADAHREAQYALDTALGRN